MVETIELLDFIGGNQNPTDAKVHDFQKLLNYSKKNRIELLYLNTLKNNEGFAEFEDLHSLQVRKYSATFDAVEKISKVLSKSDIDHAVFKTVRPYIFNTVDIDIVVFGEQFHYEKAVRVLLSARYEKIVRGPMSTTFRDPKLRIGIDLYDEIAVSYVPYIDKNKICDFVTDKEIPGHHSFRTLACEADLLAIIAHSIIKENLYVLSEYFTYIYYLDQLDVDRFIRLARRTHLIPAIRTHTSVTAVLYKKTHGNLTQKLKEILRKLGSDPVEIERIEQNCFKMPYRYHPLTIVRCLFGVAREKKTMKGITNQAIKSFNREFLQDFLKKLKEHANRETY